jgi:polar amino acid transport system substrate-binding protein
MRAMVLCVAVTAASLVVSAQTTQLRLVSTAWAPFTNQAGQPRFALDLVEAGLGRIGVKCQTTIVDAAQFTTSLLTGPFDGSAAAWRDIERERVLLFSQPYLENRLILVARRGGDVSAGALSDLKGKRIAIVEGYAYGDIENAGPTFVRARAEEESLKMLLDNGVDYTLMDDLVVQYIISNYPEQARTRLQVGSKPLLTRQLYLAIRRALPDAESIVNRFNAQLRGMIADGTYHRLLHVGWIRADVDGDGLMEYVPQSDRAGQSAPSSAYNLFLSDQQKTRQPRNSQQRFMIGGSIYDGWTQVPDRFKVEDPKRPDPNKATLGIFRFAW